MTETSQAAEAQPNLRLISDTAAQDIPWSSAPRLILGGICMGTADMVPGVSGGTLAVALGIYRQLLAAISSVGMPALRAVLKGNWKQALEIVHWRFVLCLGIGILGAVAIMGKVVRLHELVNRSPQPVYAVFFGLVIASTILLARRIPKFTAKLWAYSAIGAGLGLLVVTLVPTETPETPLFVFLSGMIAICAMILPGISGAFILLVLGKYEYIINAVLHFDLAIAVPFVLGCTVGIMAFSRVLGKALDRYHDQMLAGLTGLLVGSLWRIWPYQHLETKVIREKLRVLNATAYWPDTLDISVVLLALAGALIVFGVERFAHSRTRNLLSANPVPPSK